jgi:hypothetical protein
MASGGGGWVRHTLGGYGGRFLQTILKSSFWNIILSVLGCIWHAKSMTSCSFCIWSSEESDTSVFKSTCSDFVFERSPLTSTFSRLKSSAPSPRFRYLWVMGQNSGDYIPRFRVATNCKYPRNVNILNGRHKKLIWKMKASYNLL